MARSRPPVTIGMIWAILPLALLATSGMVGPVLGALAAGINLGLMNRRWPLARRCGVTAAVSLMAAAVWFAFGRIQR